MPNSIVEIQMHVSPHRLQATAPCYTSRMFDQDHMFYAVRTRHFGDALQHYLMCSPGAVDCEDSREQVLCSMARGLFVVNCLGSC